MIQPLQDAGYIVLEKDKYTREPAFDVLSDTMVESFDLVFTNPPFSELAKLFKMLYGYVKKGNLILFNLIICYRLIFKHIIIFYFREGLLCSCATGNYFRLGGLQADDRVRCAGSRQVAHAKIPPQRRVGDHCQVRMVHRRNSWPEDRN